VPKIEETLSTEQLMILGGRIIKRFYADCSGGTKFGCDWPTMNLLFPNRTQVFRRLKYEFNKRKDK
jgi:hypothetical protein